MPRICTLEAECPQALDYTGSVRHGVTLEYAGPQGIRTFLALLLRTFSGKHVRGGFDMVNPPAVSGRVGAARIRPPQHRAALASTPSHRRNPGARGYAKSTLKGNALWLTFPRMSC